VIVPPPAGTWAQLPGTTFTPAFPAEEYELGSNPEDLFANSGGDLATVDGTLCLLVWGHGHAAGADNSLYCVPLDGSGARRLMGPYLAPDMTPENVLWIYKYDSPLEVYNALSRNQAAGITPGLAPKSRHSYWNALTIAITGVPHFFCVGGVLNIPAGSGSFVTRIFDLTQTYAQAMARPDMGWERKADALEFTTACMAAWDTGRTPKPVVVVRKRNNWYTHEPEADVWTQVAQGIDQGSDWQASVAINVTGRKMWVLGDRLAEVIDLDTYAMTAYGHFNPGPPITVTGPEWTRGFITPYWAPGGYSGGCGMGWHPGRQRIIAFIQKNPASGLDLGILEIDPVAGTTLSLPMTGTLPDLRLIDAPYGRFRLLPGDEDTVILAGRTSKDIYIGRLPESGAPPPPPPPSPKITVRVHV
jgi:hypothetical protein